MDVTRERRWSKRDRQKSWDSGGGWPLGLQAGPPGEYRQLPLHIPPTWSHRLQSDVWSRNQLATARPSGLAVCASVAWCVNELGVVERRREHIGGLLVGVDLVQRHRRVTHHQL